MNYVFIFELDVSVNGDLVKPQEPINCEAGDCLQTHIKVSNCLEKPLRQLTMTIQFYQDYQNGVCNYRLETRLATAGATK